MAGRDADLFLRAGRGDVAAFGEVVRRYEVRVRAVLSRLLDDDRDVEEAAQDVFVQAWRNLPGFRGDAAPFTWLYRIAVNEALQRVRRRRVETVPLDDSLTHPATASPAAAGPPARAEGRELRDFLVARIRALPMEYRAPLVLRDVEGLSQAEVAEALGISLAAAKGRIHRARMKLREEIEEWRAGLPPG
ncbi:MAG: sigma-70 family RNA polymerase sigma factor [Actinomycetota bacterium]